jgi:ketosteroid isomerase-like protein
LHRIKGDEVNRKHWLRVVGSTLLLVACRPAPDLASEREALMQVSRDWSNLVATGNIDSIMTGWADDAIMMAPGLPPLEGKAAIRGYVEAAMRLPGFTIEWEPLAAHVAPSGDFAYLIERNKSTVNDSSGKPITTYGKAVTVWRKNASGEWKNVVDIWNEAPPPKP